MRLIKRSLAGLVLSGILAMMSAAAFAHGGGGGHGGGGRGHGFGGGGLSAGRGGGTAIRMGPGMHRNFAFHENQRFFNRGHRFSFQQFVWPVYTYPYDYSYLDYRPDYDYQYWDDSAAPVQPESFRRPVDNRPVVAVINTGKPGSTDSSSNAAYVDRAYSSTGAGGQQRIVMQEPNEKIGLQSDPATSVAPVAPQPTQAAAKATQAAPRAHAGAFGNLVLVSWLEDGGKDVIYVQNTETNDVQKITSEPNLDNFRIVEVHPNTDPRLFEAVISNGSEQGPVRFRF